MDRRYCVRVTPYSLEQDRIERIVDSDVRLVLLDLSETEMVNVPLLDRIIECYDRLRRRGKEFRIKVHDEDIISVFKFLKLSGLLLQHHGGAGEGPGVDAGAGDDRGDDRGDGRTEAVHVRCETMHPR